MACAPSIVSRLLTKQIISLGAYFNFPKNGKGEILIDAARIIIKDFLNQHPAFRSQDTECICYSIRTYFQNHPNEIPIQPN